MTAPRCSTLGLGLLVLVALAGCVHLKPASRTPGPAAVILEGVPLTGFGALDCGAGSLSAVMAYWGQPVSIEALDATLPKADNGGVLSLDMALAARRQGFDAALLIGDSGLIERNLRQGRPLILMLQMVDLVGKRRDLYHYVVVDGIDPDKRLVRVQYGDGKARWVPLARLETAWDDTANATLVISPGGQASPTSEPLLYAIALEEAGLSAEAESLYRHLLEFEPDSAQLWVNLGNVLDSRDEGAEAEEAYRRALEIEPMQRDALNNLAWRLLQSGGDLAEAQELVSRAVALGGPDPYLALDTMGRILLAMERCEKAIEIFGLALETAPEASTAQGWVLHGLALAQRDCGEIRSAKEILERILRTYSDGRLLSSVGSELRALSQP